MSFKERIKPDYIIKKLSIEEFNEKPEFYQQSFNEITISQKLCSSNDHNDLFGPENWTIFFQKHPINSIVYIMEKGKIVSFMYCTPHRDYERYDDTDLEHWGVNYIQTHKNFERKGYAHILILAALEDMKKKGARRLDFMPNRRSNPIFVKVINDNNIGKLTEYNIFHIRTLFFDEKFLNQETSIEYEQNK